MTATERMESGGAKLERHHIRTPRDQKRTYTERRKELGEKEKREGVENVKWGF